MRWQGASTSAQQYCFQKKSFKEVKMENICRAERKGGEKKWRIEHQDECKVKVIKAEGRVSEAGLHGVLWGEFGLP